MLTVSMAASEDADEVLRKMYSRSTYFQQLHSILMQQSTSNEHNAEFLSCLAPSVLHLVDVSNNGSLLEQPLIDPDGLIDLHALDACFLGTEDHISVIKGLAVAIGAAMRDSCSGATRRAHLFSGLPFCAALPQAYNDVLHGGEGQL
jgi:hypothetical protein